MVVEKTVRITERFFDNNYRTDLNLFDFNVGDYHFFGALIEGGEETRIFHIFFERSTNR